jgi:hypothetical protein
VNIGSHGGVECRMCGGVERECASDGKVLTETLYCM